MDVTLALLDLAARIDQDAKASEKAARIFFENHGTSTGKNASDLLDDLARDREEHCRELLTIAERAPAIRGRLRDAVVRLHGGENIRALLAEISAEIEPVDNSPLYLGDGRIRIGQTVEFINPQNAQRFVETLLDNGGAAKTRELESNLVSNPATTCTWLQNWRDGALSEFITRPTARNAGYRTTIRDGRNVAKNSQE